MSKIKSFQKTIIFLILLNLSQQAKISSHSQKKTKSTNKITVQQDNSYDRFLFATSWGGSTCVFHRCSHYGSPTVFNIHGLWPSTAKQSPQSCTETDFSEQNLSPHLQKVLFRFWNSYYHDNWEFLDHEITKHGTCWDPKLGNKEEMDSSIVDLLNQVDESDPYNVMNNYLEVVLAVDNLYNPYEDLKAAGIVPSDSEKYNIDDVVAVFNNKYGLTRGVLPVCLADKGSGELYLAELRFCLDLEYKPIDCQEGVVYSHMKRCKQQELKYPVFPN